MPPRPRPAEKWARGEVRKVEKAAQALGLRTVPAQLYKLQQLLAVDRSDEETISEINATLQLSPRFHRPLVVDPVTRLILCTRELARVPLPLDISMLESLVPPPALAAQTTVTADTGRCLSVILTVRRFNNDCRLHFLFHDAAFSFPFSIRFERFGNLSLGPASPHAANCPVRAWISRFRRRGRRPSCTCHSIPEVKAFRTVHYALGIDQLQNEIRPWLKPLLEHLAEDLVAHPGVEISDPSAELPTASPVRPVRRLDLA